MVRSEKQRGLQLKKVLRGGAMFSAGDLGARFLQFIIGVAVIRFLLPKQYGLLTLALTITSVAAVFSTLGFSTGLPRFVAIYQQRRSQEAVLGVGIIALVVAVMAAILVTGMLFLGSERLAASVNKLDLGWVLGVTLLSVPASVAISTLSAIFRGMENARAKVLFEDIGLNLSRALLLVPIMALSWGLDALVWVYVVGAWLACLIYGLYFLREFLGVKFALSPRVAARLSGRLVVFSFPLFGAAVMGNIMNWAGPLALGYASTVEQLGYFNPALRVAGLLTFPLSAMVFLYLPMATKLASEGSLEELQALYTSITKWSFFISVPLVLYILFEAELVVRGLFGDAYGEVADVLRILIVGFSVNSLLGPNGMTLVALGYSRAIFVGSVIGVVSTIVLCIVLVVPLGAVGAGIGTGVGLAVGNIFNSAMLYARTGIHPFAREYIKPLLLVLLSSIGVALTLDPSEARSLWIHLWLPWACVLITLAAPLVTKTVTEVDLDVLRSVEWKLTGRNWITDRLGWAARSSTKVIGA